MKQFYDVIIVGGGPAGLTAALYLGRAGIKTLVIAKDGNIGGQMNISPLLENVPGFYGQGADLTTEIMDQLSRYDNIEFDYEAVRRIDHTSGYEDRFRVCLQTGDSYYSNYVIAATGASPILLDIEGEGLPHVHYCATCDGAFYKNKNVVVIGGGNSALQYALELAQYCNKVEICTVMDKLQGEQNLIEKVKNNKKIKVNYCFVTNKIDKHNVYAEDDSKLAADGVFIAIGHKPDTSYYNNCAKEKGLFLTDELCAVKSQGFYAIGDCRKKPFNQVVIAMSDGCIAAMDIIRTMSK